MNRPFGTAAIIGLPIATLLVAGLTGCMQNPPTINESALRGVRSIKVDPVVFPAHMKLQPGAPTHAFGMLGLLFLLQESPTIPSQPVSQLNQQVQDLSQTLLKERGYAISNSGNDAVLRLTFLEFDYAESQTAFRSVGFPPVTVAAFEPRITLKAQLIDQSGQVLYEEHLYTLNQGLYGRGRGRIAAVSDSMAREEIEANPAEALKRAAGVLPVLIQALAIPKR
jgi:hypothetical protein